MTRLCRLLRPTVLRSSMLGQHLYAIAHLSTLETRSWIACKPSQIRRGLVWVLWVKLRVMRTDACRFVLHLVAANVAPKLSIGDCVAFTR